MVLAVTLASALALCCTAGTPATTDDTQPGDDGGTASPGTPTLTVSGGYGGGSYAAGSSVQVWADVDPHAAIVTGWTGDSSVLEQPAEWNSALTMPDQDLDLSPVLQTVAFPISIETLTLADGTRQYSLVAPDSPVGVVLFFHGAAYSRDELTDAAATNVGMRLVRAGYAVAALDSQAAAGHGSGGWSSSADSVDLDNVRTLVADLQGRLGDLPVYAWGMSSGGQFAHLVGAELPAQGVLASCAPGTADIAARTTAPTAWFVAGADGTFPTSPEDAAKYAAQLQARGLSAEVHVHPPTPLYDQRFTRVPGIDAATSAEIATWIRDQGYVDAAGAWQVSGRTVTAALSLPDLDSTTRTAVAAEIEIMAADHELYDDLGAAMVTFLDGLR